MFGDSTMNRLYKWGSTYTNLVSTSRQQVLENTNLVSCKVQDPSDRCHLNEQFGYDYPPEWVPPTLGHGPILYGLENPYCQDCRGCYPSLLECSATKNQTALNEISRLTDSEKMELIYGSFMGVEFAKDVELQTDQYATTQENVVAYVRNSWNAPELLEIWQPPTCLVNTGHHDVLLPNMTQQVYLDNVQWYLHLLADVCQSILWLATTAPQSDDFAQKINTTKDWGTAVQRLIENDGVLQPKTLYINVFAASRTFPHRDNRTF